MHSNASTGYTQLPEVDSRAGTTLHACHSHSFVKLPVSDTVYMYILLAWTMVPLVGHEIGGHFEDTSSVSVTPRTVYIHWIFARLPHCICYTGP